MIREVFEQIGGNIMSQRHANLLMVLVTAGWGSSYLFTKFAVADLQPIGAGIFTGGGNKHTGGPVFIPGKNGHIVFHFNIVVLGNIAECGDFCRHTADPLPQIQIMGRLV